MAGERAPSRPCHARLVVNAIRGVAERLVTVSSMDVYRAYGRIHGTEPGPLEPLPLGEEARLREHLYPVPRSCSARAPRRSARRAPTLKTRRARRARGDRRAGLPSRLQRRRAACAQHPRVGTRDRASRRVGRRPRRRHECVDARASRRSAARLLRPAPGRRHVAHSPGAQLWGDRVARGRTAPRDRVVRRGAAETPRHQHDSTTQPRTRRY